MSKRDIDIQSIVHLRGPNLWSYIPTLESLIDIGELEECPSDKVPGMYERLVEWLPSLIEHRCSPGVRGGFLQRLRTGTWPCHVLEHVTIALQDLAGVPGHFGRARETNKSGVYKVVVSAWQFEVTKAALFEGRKLVLAAMENTPYDLQAGLAHLRELVQEHCLGPSTAAITFAAEDREIPVIRLNTGNLVQFGYGCKQRRIWTAETDRTSAIAETISRDKDLTKSLLEACGVPIPQGRAVDSAADAWDAAQDLGLPVVVKPVDGNHGRGVFTNLLTQKEVEAAYDVAVDEGSGVLVERFILGNEHRLLIVGGKLAAAAKGQTASVIGDGKHTVHELIQIQINSDPRRGSDEDQPLNPVRIDSAARLELERQGLHADAVPAAGVEVLIQRNGNVAFDCTKDVHPEVTAMAALAAKAVGLDVAGIDLVALDISRPLNEQGGAIVEVNAGPGLLMHLKPAEGEPQPVGKIILDHMFPEGEHGIMPLVGITGSEGTTLVARIVHSLLSLRGLKTGIASTEGLAIGQRQLRAGNCATWDDARRLLLNCEVEAAVIENSGMEIIKNGLAYEKCTVGIVTNIIYTDEMKRPDIAYHDFEEASDLVKVYRTQADVVLEDGCSVLNAQDPNVAEIAQYSGGSVTLYSLDPNLPMVIDHLSEGKRAILVENGKLILAEGSVKTALCDLAEIPVTENGSKPEQIRCVMAAAAAAWALDFPTDLIQAGLEAFKLET
ncbi:cyanophycin synthetase [Orrella sp. NBD-18]|uniref:Cyanophycin synthetase n=1 Tax=Sheuella amnicola TaxID=2707330 RepID=A0A6B2R0Z0_9BURK|nr:cyanophycin synthetase [Sheuella amnicola]HBI82927.1 cyanophycin synthetase [Alcaligenaceae bacterium]